MAEWDPQQYLQFKQDRLRPVNDLVRRIEHIVPKTAVDLGCGPATSTRILGEQFVEAKIIGLDNSQSMINEARKNYPDADYLVADATGWVPDNPVDLIFSNAVFHWLPDHENLLSRLAGALNAGGTLAVQMPDNMAEPSHLAIRQVAGSERFEKLLQSQFSSRNDVASANEYYEWLKRDFVSVDIWQTSYAHILPGHSYIVDWMKGAALTPFLSALDQPLQKEFLDDYLNVITNSYRNQKDGNVIFQFPRLFFVARKN